MGEKKAYHWTHLKGDRDHHWTPVKEIYVDHHVDSNERR
jgi:hypothetical protein